MKRRPNGPYKVSKHHNWDVDHLSPEVLNAIAAGAIAVDDVLAESLINKYYKDPKSTTLSKDEMVDKALDRVIRLNERRAERERRDSNGVL